MSQERSPRGWRGREGPGWDCALMAVGSLCSGVSPGTTWPSGQVWVEGTQTAFELKISSHQKCEKTDHRYLHAHNQPRQGMIYKEGLQISQKQEKTKQQKQSKEKTVNRLFTEEETPRDHKHIQRCSALAEIGRAHV